MDSLNNPIGICYMLIHSFIILIGYYYFKTKKGKNIFDSDESYIKTYAGLLTFLIKLLPFFLLPFSVVFISAIILYFISNISYLKYLFSFSIKSVLLIGILYLLLKNYDLLKNILTTKPDIANMLLIINNTSNQITVILLMIILIITSLLPYIIKKFTSYDGEILIDKPVYLHNKYSKGSEDILYNVKPRNYNYSISLWFWLTPQPSNTNYAYQKYTNILTFDKKPGIQYNGSNNTLQVLFDGSDKEETIFSSSDILYQKWNNLVINYTGGNVDVFLNSELLGSKTGIAPFYKYTFIDIGEKNGLHGGISNVVFYNSPLTLSKIKLNYNFFKMLDEPYI
jgi:hypothetical protein